MEEALILPITNKSQEISILILVLLLSFNIKKETIPIPIYAVLLITNNPSFQKLTNKSVEPNIRGQ